MKLKNILLTIGLISILTLASTTSALQPHAKTEHFNNQHITLSFTTPTITITQETTQITIPECTTYLQKTGAPTLPIYTTKLEYPLGTKITDIHITTTTPTITQLTQALPPTPRPIISPNQPLPQNYNQPDPSIYEQNTYYPSTWYTHKLTGGLNRNNEHVTLLTLHIFPTRYNPITQQVSSIEKIDIEITTNQENTKTFLEDEYDLLILSYDRFTRLLAPLVEHKESHNIPTKLVSLNEVYDGTHFTTEGRDNPEKIKYFIKNAIEQWGITHVLLVGNFRKMPIRYAHLETDAGGTYEELKFPSDLYFQDIYDSTGNFSTWDTDNDGIYGEWPDPWPMEDIIDLRPDVHVGRLACMFGFEVYFAVKKIIDYEENTKGTDWFNNFIGIGGDTFDKKWEGGTDYNEGEEATEKAIEFMTGYNPIRIYTTLNNISKANMSQKINEGSGFLYFVGHGNPTFWATHYNGDYKNWTEGFGNKDILKLSNKGMYNIMMVGGCHNSQFDVSPLNLLIDPEHSLYFSTHSFWCWSWAFVTRHNGGSIASMGSTGYGGVNIGDSNSNGIPDCVEGADGWFETQFFRIYNEENVDILGETYSQVVSDYIDNFPVFSDRYDCKIIETHVLMGDPTLKIGGY